MHVKDCRFLQNLGFGASIFIKVIYRYSVLLGFANYVNRARLFLDNLLTSNFGGPLCKLTFYLRI